MSSRLCLSSPYSRSLQTRLPFSGPNSCPHIDNSSLWCAHAPRAHWLHSNKLVAFHRLIYLPEFTVTFICMSCTRRLHSSSWLSCSLLHTETRKKSKMYINILIICSTFHGACKWTSFYLFIYFFYFPTL